MCVDRLTVPDPVVSMPVQYLIWWSIGIGGGVGPGLGVGVGVDQCLIALPGGGAEAGLVEGLSIMTMVMTMMMMTIMPSDLPQEPFSMEMDENSPQTSLVVSKLLCCVVPLRFGCWGTDSKVKTHF